MSNANKTAAKTKMSTCGMRVGLEMDRPNIAGWCFFKSSTGNRMWINEPLPRNSAVRICHAGGWTWARRFVIEGDRRMILA